MPTYSVDLGGTPIAKQVRQIGSDLANIFTPDYEGEANARLRAAQATSSYASADAARARARASIADAIEQERINKIWADYDTTAAGLSGPELIQYQYENLFPLGKVDAGNFGDYRLGGGGLYGDLTPEEWTTLQLAAGADYGKTIEGTQEAMFNDNQRWLEEQAAAAAADTVQVFGEDGETPILVPRSQAVAEQMRPVLSDTDEKGIQRATGQMPEEDGYWDGTGFDSVNTRIVYELSPKMQDGTATPDEQRAYTMAFTNLSRPKVAIQTINGVPQQVTIPPAIPPGIFIPGAGPTVEAAAVQGPGPVVQPQPPVINNAPAVAGAASDVAVPGPAPAPVMPAAPALATPGITISPIPGVEPPPPKAQTEAQARYGQYAERIKGGMIPLMRMMGYDATTGQLAPGGWRPSLMGGLVEDFAPSRFTPYLQEQIDPNERLFYTRVAQTLNPLIRADSGAAVPDSEYPRYYAQYIPQAGESDAVVKAKLDHLLVTQMAFKEISETPEGRLAAQTGDPSSLHAMMQVAKARIADEQRISMAQFTYGPDGVPQLVGIREPGGAIRGTEALTPTPGGIEDPAGPRTPMVIELPGGLPATEIID